MKQPALYRMLTEDQLVSADQRALLETAAALRRAEQAGFAQPLLRGKHIALMCGDPHCETARRFLDAATRLGAQVSRIQADAAATGPDDGERDARMLGRLYDALECEHAPAEVAERLRRIAGVPVFNGVARPGNALMQLWASQTPVEPTEAEERSLVQSLLVHTLG